MAQKTTRRDPIHRSKKGRSYPRPTLVEITIYPPKHCLRGGGYNDMACSAKDGGKDKSSVDPDTGSRRREIPARMRQTPNWMPDSCLSYY